MSTVVTITRHRHSYLHTIIRNGVKSTPAEIDRLRAEEIIRTNSNGQLPVECNLDICQPRRWTWQIEVDTI
jgi:hypothetical protein